ncbi:MAG: LPXTG cell wall anchor domain-containing protein [Chloroflexota bacterium]
MTGTSLRAAATFLLSGALLTGAAAAAYGQTFSGVRLTNFAIAGAPTSVRAGSALVFNASSETFPHNLAIDGMGVDIRPTNPNIAAGATGTITLTAPTTPGTYVLFCPVGTHRANGMLVPLTVVAGAAALPATGGAAGMAIPAGLAVAGLAAGAAGVLLRRRSA